MIVNPSRSMKMVRKTTPSEGGRADGVMAEVGTVMSGRK
jgi:hypothetical protein